MEKNNEKIGVFGKRSAKIRLFRERTLHFYMCKNKEK